MNPSQYICRRCGLPVRRWFFGWKHSGGGGSRPSCGQSPDPIPRDQDHPPSAQGLLPCPVPKCQRLRRRDQVMCSVCWSQVPRHLQFRVWRLWRVARETDQYQAAVTAAVAEAGLATWRREGFPEAVRKERA